MTDLDGLQANPELTRAMVPSVRSIAPQIVFAGILPVVAYALLRPHVSSDATALSAVLVFPVLEVLVERIRRGSFEPIGIIALIGIGAGLLGVVALNGDAILLKVRESLVTGLFGAICLASLATHRPIMFYLGRAFATGGNPEKAAEFNLRWQLPTVPQRFRFATILWGVALLAEAIVRTILAVIISTQLFLILSTVIFWGVIGGLMWFTVVFSRASEERVVEIMGTLEPT